MRLASNGHQNARLSVRRRLEGKPRCFRASAPLLPHTLGGQHQREQHLPDVVLGHRPERSRHSLWTIRPHLFAESGETASDSCMACATRSCSSVTFVLMTPPPHTGHAVDLVDRQLWVWADHRPAPAAA